MCSTNPLRYKSSSTLPLILQLKPLLLCFSTVGELRHSWTFFQCSLWLCLFWFPKWQVIALNLSHSLQQGVEQKVFQLVGACLILLDYPIIIPLSHTSMGTPAICSLLTGTINWILKEKIFTSEHPTGRTFTPTLSTLFSLASNASDSLRPL